MIKVSPYKLVSEMYSKGEISDDEFNYIMNLLMNKHMGYL